MILKSLDQDVYENEVISSKSDLPALLCFFKSTASQKETAISIEDLCHQFEFVQFYAAPEEEHEYFFGRYHFLGTPIFIFLVNGMERARLLGEVTTDRLRSFIESNICKLTPQ